MPALSRSGRRCPAPPAQPALPPFSHPCPMQRVQVQAKARDTASRGCSAQSVAGWPGGARSPGALVPPPGPGARLRGSAQPAGPGAVQSAACWLCLALPAPTTVGLPIRGSADRRSDCHRVARSARSGPRGPPGRHGVVPEEEAVVDVTPRDAGDMHCCDDPLASEYTISRINPAFKDESLSAGRAGRPASGSSGYASGSSSGSSSPMSQHWDAAEPAGDKAVDGVRQLSECLARSPALLAVRRALEVGSALGSASAAAAAGTGPGAAFVGDLGARPGLRPLWTEYLGSGIVPGDITLRAKGYEQVVDLTLDSAGADRLLALVEHGTRWRCCCRAATALLAVLVFLAAIVAVSLVVSRGRRVFGAL